jgi:hypothetical protein
MFFHVFFGELLKKSVDKGSGACTAKYEQYAKQSQYDKDRQKPPFFVVQQKIDEFSYDTCLSLAGLSLEIIF